MTISPFDIVNHINNKSELEFSMSDYKSWMITRALSNTMDTLFYANEMNQQYHLDKDIQYRFYYDGIPKGKRFGKWNKKEKTEDAELVRDYFNINIQHAQQYLSLLSDEQLKTIRETMLKGGRK
jgi:hypothetical protein